MFFLNKTKAFGLSKLPHVWFVLFFFIPFFFILKVSISPLQSGIPPFGNLFSFVQEGSTSYAKIYLYFHNYLYLLTKEIYIRALWESFNLALISTLFCLGFGSVVAYSLWKLDRKWKWLCLLLIVLPFGISFLIRIYALMGILSSKGLLNSFLIYFHLIKTPLMILDTKIAAFIGIVYCYLPLMILPIYSTLGKISHEWVEAASDLGATPWSSLQKIVFPLAKPGIVAGCSLVFIPSFGEFVIPEVLGGEKTFTLGRLVWDTFFHLRDWPLACSMAALIIFPILILTYIIQRIRY